MEETKHNSEQNTDPAPASYEKYLRDDSWKDYLPHNGFFYTPILILLNILVFIVMAINGMNVMDPDGDIMVLWGSNFTPLTLNGEYWRLLTAGFLHFGIFHLLMNMYGLLLIGSLLEPLLGSLRFFIAYTLCLLGGSVLSLWWHELANAAGASGAVFGMYGVFISLLLTNLIDKSERKELLMSMLFVVGFNLIYGLQGNIDNAGHIGGLITGIVVGFTLFPSLKNKGNAILTYSSIFVTSVIIIVSSILIVRSIPNSFSKYDSLMEKFTTNETMALDIFKNQEAAILAKEIINTGLPKWNENLVIISQLDSLERLPEHYKSHIQKLKTYTNLRLEEYNMLYKANLGDSSYNKQIDIVAQKINKLFDNPQE